MILSDFFSILSGRGVDQDTAVSYMQDAYDMVIKKIRLDKSIHPLRMSEAGQMGGFKYPVILSPSGSKMVFKRVSGWLKTTLDQEDIPDEYNIEDVISVDPENVDVYTAVYSSCGNTTISVSGTNIVSKLIGTEGIILDIIDDNDSVYISEMDAENTYPIIDEGKGEGFDVCILVSGFVYPYPLLVIEEGSEEAAVLLINIEYDNDIIDISNIDSNNLYEIIEV